MHGFSPDFLLQSNPKEVYWWRETADLSRMFPRLCQTVDGIGSKKIPKGLQRVKKNGWMAYLIPVLSLIIEKGCFSSTTIGHIKQNKTLYNFTTQNALRGLEAGEWSEGLILVICVFLHVLFATISLCWESNTPNKSNLIDHKSPH